MTRDERLLPRLLASLDTLENDGEIAETVRQVRRIRGDGAFFNTFLADRVPLLDERPAIALSMRKLGHILRFAPTQPEHTKTVGEVGVALALGAEWVPVADLRTALACIAEFFDLLREMQAQQERNSAAAQMNVRGGDLLGLRDAMNVVCDQINRVRR